MHDLAIKILESTSALVVLIPLAAGILYFKRLEHGMRLLLVVLAAAGVTDVTCLILIRVVHTRFLWVQHIYLLVEYTIYMLILADWVENRTFSTRIKWSIPVFVALSILNSLFLRGLEDMNNYAIALALVLYTIPALYILIRIMGDDSGNILKNHKFWIITGLLIYSAGDPAYFALHELVKEHYLIAIWEIHIILNIATYLFYFVGIICQGRRWA